MNLIERKIIHRDFTQAVAKALKFKQDHPDAELIIPKTKFDGVHRITLVSKDEEVVERPYTEDIVGEHMVCKKLVEKVLSEVTGTRDDDMLLIFEVWKRQGVDVNLNDVEMSTIFNSESIRRGRQLIQNNKGLFLPTTYAVAKRRRINEELLTEYYGSQNRY